MNGTLVCGVDGTDEARDAAALAARLSDQLDLRLVLVHVIHVPGRHAIQHDDESFWRDRQGATAMLTELVVDVDIADRAERRIVIGDTAAMLASIAAEEAADIMVIGGRRGRPLTLEGRNRLAARLGAETSVPVLVAVSQQHAGTYGRDVATVAD